MLLFKSVFKLLVRLTRYYNMRYKREILATTAVISIAGVAALVLRNNDDPLQTVQYVELEKYLGKWYEIAAFPQRFQNGCSNTSAEYSLNPDGTIAVKNSCIKDGKWSVADGEARVVDKKTNAKLTIQFQWPFKGKYWIIGLAHDYSYAVVGHPNREYLWILGRKTQMDSQTYNHLIVMAANKGFDVRKLVKTKQV